MHLSLNFERLMVKNQVFTKIVIMAVKCSSFQHSRMRQNLQIFISGFIRFEFCLPGKTHFQDIFWEVCHQTFKYLK